MTGARGEGYLDLAGETYAILFTNQAIADAERATGKTIMRLLRGFSGDDIGVADVAALLQVGLQYARRERLGTASGNDTQNAWRLLNQLGFGTVAPIVMEALVAVINYRPKGESADPPA